MSPSSGAGKANVKHVQCFCSALTRRGSCHSTSTLQANSQSSVEEQQLAQGHQDILQGACVVSPFMDGRAGTCTAIDNGEQCRAGKLNSIASAGGVIVKTGDVGTYEEYASILRDSRIVVSPLG